MTTAGLPDGVGIEVISVPPPPGNLAVTSAERRDRRIVASIQNFGNLEVKTPVRLVAGGKELAQIEVTMAPRGAVDAELLGTVPAIGDAEVRVDDATGYQADNARKVLRDPTPAVPIAVVVADPTGSTGGLYIERALTVAGNGHEFSVDVRDGREVANWNEAEQSRIAAIFVLGTRTLDRQGRDAIRNYLNRGGQVLLAHGP